MDGQIFSKENVFMEKTILNLETNMHFTIVMDYIIYDTNLTIYEKMLYVILKSYTNKNSNTVYPSHNTLSEKMNVSVFTVKKAIEGLIKKGYLKKTSGRKSIKGEKDTNNIYTIIEKIPEKKNSPQKNAEESPNPNVNNTSENSNCQVSEKYTLEQVKEYYDYDILIHDNINMKKDIDSVINILYNALNSNNKTIKVMGEQKSVMIVQSKLLKLNYEHIIYSIKKFEAVTEKIKNPSAYMLAILYQASEQMNLEFKNQINCTMYT